MRPEEVSRGEAAVVGLEGVDSRALDDRCGERRGVAPKVVGDLVAREEPVGLGAVVLAAGQADGVVRGDEPEAVPPPVPRATHATLLEHHVIDTGCREAVADREAGLTAPDDEDVDVRSHGFRVRPSATPGWGHRMSGADA